ncbi:MAG TPA: geranylgeranyl reductase family protein [Blastocatellia bacterium]|nr:geranylgeranyl reductase family protein [Blastocatellia bacterium]
MANEEELDIGESTSLPEAASQPWDVAIVGAGPAGSTAAIHLADRGHKVLLLDKDSFPRDKVCGDGLIADAVRCLGRVGLYDEVRARGFRAKVGTVYSPSRIRFDVPGEFLTLKRSELDSLMARRAIKAGAAFCQCRVTDVEVERDNTLLISTEGDQRRLRARIAFLATGANVSMPSKLGLVTREGPSAVALRCYVRSSVALDRLVISYDKSIAPGYAWIFPVGDGEFNIGCGVAYGTRRTQVNLREAFQLFITNFPLAAEIMRQAESISPIRGAMLRCGLTGTQACGPGNTLVVGETIGATFPFTGEGIGKAMETGEIAAEVAHQALETGDFTKLHEFPARIEKELRPKFLGYRIAENWFSRPWLNDFVARRISRSRFLQELVAGIVNETVDPREVFSLRGMLRSFVS